MLASKPRHRIHRIKRFRSSRFERRFLERKHEIFFLPARQRHHRVAVPERRQLLPVFVGRTRGRNKINLPQPEAPRRRFCYRDVSGVNRIERAAKYRNRALQLPATIAQLCFPCNAARFLRSSASAADSLLSELATESARSPGIFSSASAIARTSD